MTSLKFFVEYSCYHAKIYIQITTPYHKKLVDPAVCAVQSGMQFGYSYIELHTHLSVRYHKCLHRGRLSL